jgi:hypothetical protein
MLALNTQDEKPYKSPLPPVAQGHVLLQLYFRSRYHRGKRQRAGRANPPSSLSVVSMGCAA